MIYTSYYGSSGIMFRDAPSCFLYTWLRNGFCMAPPSTISSANYNIFLTNINLSCTLAPPSIANTGLFGFYTN